MDHGITERDFWEMTLGEIERAIKSKQRLMKLEAQEKASHNYILADLIGKSVSRIYSSSARMPDIGTVYPSLFDSEEIKQKKQEQKNNLSALRFKQFAQFHNQRFKGGGKDK